MSKDPYERSRAARARIRSGDRDGGRREVLAILALRDPGPGALNECALALADGDFAGEAIACMDRALAATPHDARMWVNRGGILERAGRPVSAIVAYERALELDARLEGAANNLGGAYKNLGRHREMVTSYRRACSLAPSDPRVHSNLLLALQYTGGANAIEMRDAHTAWARRFADPMSRSVSGWRNPPDPSRRLRIGYLSADFCSHPVAYFLGSLLARHDRRRVETFCYCATHVHDDLTRMLRGLCDHWREIDALDDDAAARRIRADRIDVLVDLGGHTAGNRLLVLARRPAPVQGTYLGYPDTTGMSAIDFRITDPVADPPPVADGFYSERLARTDGVFVCYRAPENAPAVSPLPSRSAPFTFASFNNTAKLGEETLALWARVLGAVPAARLLIKSRRLAEPEACAALRERFEAAGIASARLELRGPDRRFDDHLAAYNEVDVALDPVPYNGTTTTCEALWMGVPVIALAGERHASRVSSCLLHAVGLDEWVARDRDAYVAVARSAATDVDRLSRLRGCMRARVAASPLCDAKRHADAIERVYRREWRGWCATRHAAAPRLLHALSRSGETVVSRCLGAMRGVVLLSEIHPLGPALAGSIDPAWRDRFSPLDQARRWYGLEPHPELLPGMERGESVSFSTVMHALSRAASDRGAALVLRDWSHLDFFGVPFLDPAPLVSALDREMRRTPPCPRMCLVRHPAAHWASLARLPAVQGRLGAPAFLRGVNAFARATHDAPRVRYEDFCRDPARALAAICEGLGIEYDGGWESSWSANVRVTGGRGDATRIIEPVEDERFHAARDDLAVLGGYAELCAELGYDPATL